MNNPQKPDANEFARQMLFHISGIHAQMQIVLQMMARERFEKLSDCDDLYVRWMEEAGKIQMKFYFEALEKAGIPPTANPPESPGAR